MAGAMAQSQKTVRAWDGPTRVFHWLLVFGILSAWVSYEFAEVIGDVSLKWHRSNGLGLLILVVWRVLWGFAGSSTARFASFVRGPRAVLSYVRGLVTDEGRRFLGHNPAGGLVVVAFLGVVLLQGGLGLFATDDNDLVGGPLYRLVSEATNAAATHWHEEVFEVGLLPLIVLHVAAIVFYAVVKRERLVPAMITGRKSQEAYVDGEEADIVARPWLRAGFCLGAAAAIVLGGILVLGGSLKL